MSSNIGFFIFAFLYFNCFWDLKNNNLIWILSLAYKAACALINDCYHPASDAGSLPPASLMKIYYYTIKTKLLYKKDLSVRLVEVLWRNPFVDYLNYLLSILSNCINISIKKKFIFKKRANSFRRTEVRTDLP